ncbi:hypothetical protein NUW54_g9835 [Trametes sanguinea]|uniref:Uncharacterized protein n=1 Tax=Trametes sanguinea TaxID=158606 RepID=A0ACC1P4I5_9APHY|nr:hypothetical protein NUW54_g9835 [Trametes sanguinea]
MSGLQEILQGNVRDSLPLLTLVKCAGVFSTTLLLLEILSTLEDEVALIWPSRWSLMKVIFLVNRYSPFIDTTLGLTVMLGTTDPKLNLTSSVGRIMQTAMPSDRSSLNVGSRHPSFVIAISSWSISYPGRSDAGVVQLRTLGAGYHGGDISRSAHPGDRRVLDASYPDTVSVPTHSRLLSCKISEWVIDPDRMVLQITGCVPSVDDSRAGCSICVFSSLRPVCCVIIYIQRILMRTRAVVVSLTVRKMWQMFAGGTAHRSLLVWTMYRDGSLYYVLLLVVSIGNLCFMLLAPKAATSIMQMPLRVVHSTLCTRVLLNLRKVASRLSEMSLDEFNRRSHIAFEHTGADHHSIAHIELGRLDSEDSDYR